MPRSCEDALAARAWASKPRVLPAPIQPPPPTPEPLPQLALIEDLLRHYLIRPLEQRQCRAYVGQAPADAARLAKALARLEALVVKRHGPPNRLTESLDRTYSPAYAARHYPARPDSP